MCGCRQPGRGHLRWRTKEATPPMDSATCGAIRVVLEPETGDWNDELTVTISVPRPVSTSGLRAGDKVQLLKIPAQGGEPAAYPSSRCNAARPSHSCLVCSSSSWPSSPGCRRPRARRARFRRARRHQVHAAGPPRGATRHPRRAHRFRGHHVRRPVPRPRVVDPDEYRPRGDPFRRRHHRLPGRPRGPPRAVGGVADDEPQPWRPSTRRCALATC